MHETSSYALLIHFHSAPYALYNAPFDLGFKKAARLDVPDGKVLDAMVDFSDAMGGSWAYADGGPRTRQGSPVTAGRRTVPTPRSPTRRRQQQSSAGWRRRNAQKMRSHRCDRAFCRGGNFSKYRGQLGFGSHLGSIANRLFLYTFGIIIGDTHKFQYRATGVQLLHCCHLMGDGRWTAMATRAFPCR